MVFFNFLLLITLVFTLSVSVFADIIRLKDGSVIKGKVVGFRDGQFIVIIGTGNKARQMNFFVDEVESIEFDSGTAQVSDQIVLTMKKTEAVQQSQPSRSIKTIQDTENNQEINDVQQEKIKDSVAKENSRTVVIKSDPIAEKQKKVEPIRINVKVLADSTANGWTSAGFVVKKGQRIRIAGKGQVYLGNGNFCGPEGMKTLADPEKLIPDAPTGALIAVIGDDNNDFIFIGAQNEFIAQREGILFLGVNEGNLDDNSGSFDVIVEIEP